MILNFLFFTVKIERNVASVEQKLARYEQEMRLKARQEAHYLEAAAFPEYATRL